MDYFLLGPKGEGNEGRESETKLEEEIERLRT